MVKPLSKSTHFRSVILMLCMVVCHSSFSRTWADTLDSYARESFLPASRYMWTWQDAALLHTMVKEYDRDSIANRANLEYVRKAMDKSLHIARGKTPNGVASGLGMAFMYRITREAKYKKAADKIYADYLKIRRTNEGAVSHLSAHTELWDDTMFMIGEFLLGMYQATGEEQYIQEFSKQMRLHREKLQDREIGLWRHGWDADNKDHCYICGQLHWPDKQTRQSAEIWGRGNGWIVVTLADALAVIPRSNPHWSEMAGYLKEMIAHLPDLQDKTTGHWYQLPVRNKDPHNFIESSCTAMFALGMLKAVELKLVPDSIYRPCIDRAYAGLRRYSLVSKGGKYLTTQNVCTATCIGDKDYYLHRSVQQGKPYAIGMFIRFGREYQTVR